MGDRSLHSKTQPKRDRISSTLLGDRSVRIWVGRILARGRTDVRPTMINFQA